MPKKAKLKIGETSSVIADEIRREMNKTDEKRNKGFAIEVESRLPGIKENYPDITPGEAAILPKEELNKMSISLLERLIKDYKGMLQDTFKTSKEWKCSEEDINWYKDLLRDNKNSLEVYHKEVVQEQSYIKNGLNPPFYYKH